MSDERTPGRIFGSAFDFLKILGASLTGLTAILTAAGFLAERARLAMLGLPSSTFDLEQYVETGALLLALLPVVMGIALLLISVAWMKALLAGVITAIGGMGLVAVLLLGSVAGLILFVQVRRRSQSDVDSPASSDWMRRLTDRRPWVRSYGFALLLALALALQITSVAREVAVLDLRDMLFTSRSEQMNLSSEAGDTTQDAGVQGSDEMAAVVADTRGDRHRPVRLFGEIVLLTVINASVIYFVIRRRFPVRRSGGKQLMLTAWCVVSILLLISQVTLLPVSYGVLVSRNTYPQVCAALSEAALAGADLLPNTRLALVHQTENGFYFYSRSHQKMWYVPRSDVKSLVHHARTDILDPSETQPCETEVGP